MSSKIKSCVLILSAIFIYGCGEKDYPKPCRHEPLNQTLYLKGFNPYYFDRGTWWKYLDSISGKTDIISVLNASNWTKKFLTCEYDFTLTDAKVEMYSTFSRKYFDYDIIGSTPNTLRHYGEVYMSEKDKIKTLVYLQHGMKNELYYPFIKDSFPFEINSKHFSTSITECKIENSKTHFYWSDDIGVVKKVVYKNNSDTIIQNWNIIEYEVVR